MDLERYDEYVSHLFQPCFIPATRALLYSAICQAFLPLEKEYRRRFRLNVMFHWKAGWMKSSLGNFVGGMLPEDRFKVSEVLSSSSAALRGSFYEGKFFPPEFIISDVLMFSELSSIVKTDDDMMGVLLSAMEEGRCKSMAIKNLAATPRTIQQVEHYGAKLIDGRLEFNNRAVVWAFTHTIEVIPPKHMDAFLGRFLVKQIDESEFDYQKVKQNPQDRMNPQIEAEIKDEVREVFDSIDRPNLDFAYEVLQHTKMKLTPREAGDFVRCVIAHKCIEPTISIMAMVSIMESFFQKLEVLSPKERIARYIKMLPRTHQEIVEACDVSAGSVYTILSRLKAQKKGNSRGKLYFLD